MITNKNLIFLINYIILISACETKISDKDTFDTSPNIKNSPKIGVEIEYNVPFFYKKNGEFRYFDVKQVIGINKENSFELQSDFNSNEGYSDIEFVTHPFPFNKDGKTKLYTSIKKILTHVNSICKASETKTGYVLLEEIRKKSINQSDVGQTLLSKLKTDDQTNLNNIKTWLDIDFVDSNEVFSLGIEHYNRVVPQFTFPMSLESLTKLCLSYAESSKSYNGAELIFRWDHIDDFFENYESLELKQLLHRFHSDSRLKGFLLLLQININALKNTSQTSVLKNNLPIVKARNDFATIFKTLPRLVQKIMKQENAKYLLKAISIITGYSEQELNTPLFGGKVLHETYLKPRLLLQHLTVSTWLKEITKGNDLLLIQNHKSYFPDAKEDDLEELEDCFGDFGDKLEYVNNQPCGIFEWRENRSIETHKTLEYIIEKAEFFYSLNQLNN